MNAPGDDSDILLTPRTPQSSVALSLAPAHPQVRAERAERPDLRYLSPNRQGTHGQTCLLTRPARRRRQRAQQGQLAVAVPWDQGPSQHLWTTERPHPAGRRTTPPPGGLNLGHCHSLRHPCRGTRGSGSEDGPRKSRGRVEPHTIEHRFDDPAAQTPRHVTFAQCPPGALYKADERAKILVMKPVGRLVAGAVLEFPYVRVVDVQKVHAAILAEVVYHHTAQALDPGAGFADPLGVLPIVEP